MTVSEGRQRLEATLSSPALTNKDSVYHMLCSQLSVSSSSSSSLHNNYDSNSIQEMAQSRFVKLWDLLELLRSASGEHNHNLDATTEDETSTEGWKLKHDTGQLRVMYREGPKGTPFHTLLAEGLIYSPLKSALCLAWEAPSYKFWWPQMTVPTFKIDESRWVKRCSIGEDLSLIRVKVPWPLAAREVLMYAFELEVFDEELIIVLLHSVPDTPSPEQIINGLKPSEVPDASPNVVRMELAGGFALQRLSSDQSYFRTVANLDIKLEFIPPWLINFISRQLIGLGFKLYQKILISISNEERSSRHFQDLIETEPMYARIEAGLQARKAKGGKEMTLLKDAAQKRPCSGDAPIVTKSSKLEEKEAHSSKDMPSSLTEILPAELSAEGVPSNATGEGSEAGCGIENCDVGMMGLDPEVERALHVLDKMISLVQSQKVGSMSNSLLAPSNNSTAGSSHNTPKNSVETQCNGLTDCAQEKEASNLGNSPQRLEKEVPLVQVLNRTEELNVSNQSSQVVVLKTKQRWFCFKTSPLCCG